MGRIAVVTCEGGGSGSGFLVGAGTVATAAHVVEDATSISLRFGPDVFRGNVVELDEENDLALLSVDGTPGSHQFDVADGPARVGTDVAVLGYPGGRPLAMTQGAVTSVDLRVDVEGKDRRGLFRTDSAINPGNSGGPVVDSQGVVVGVVTAGSFAPGEGFAVSQPALQALLDGWDGDIEFTDTPECEDTGADPYSIPVEVSISSTSPEAPSIAQTMQLYAQGINDRYHDQTWNLLTAAMRERIGSYDAYAEGLLSSSWLTIDVVEVQAVDEVSSEAVVAFRTTQDAEFGRDGATCSDWLVRYTFALDEGFWQIDGAALEDGPQRPCSD
ncbi:S1C family serine protease [Jannaschia sp. R86511]|uniref:S1C family serine protease n=1 Tax=Jannaschia sp. R86511 TaxID=3093853 RepID=UPI0036D40196